ncbi:Nn.00g008020.m01.CDS01 [Neocucurbitaria sp. VM-36]
MEKSDKPLQNVVPIHRSLILQLLYDEDDNRECDEDDYGQCFQGSEAVVASTTHSDGFVAVDFSLSGVRIWLEIECAIELERAEDMAAAVESSWSGTKARGQGMDTKILERTRKGEGPRDAVFEDLLAPLRLGSGAEPLDGMETFDELKEVLLAWHKHVILERDGNEGRDLLITALYERLKAVNKVHEIIKDKRASEMYDKVGHEGILEPSARRILQALHVYRPETKDFKIQDPFDILVILWANTRPEVPDIKTDDEMRYLTLKVLAAETGLAQRYVDEGFRREIKKKRDSARQRKDKAEYLRLKEEKEHFDKTAAKQSIHSRLEQILSARQQLRNTVLSSLQHLTLLQAAQKLAARSTLEQKSPTRTPPWTHLHHTCAHADHTLALACHHSLPDLEASADLASSTLHSLRALHAKALTRTLKLTGQDLDDNVDAVTRRRIIEDRKNEAVTACMMSETFTGVLQSIRAAGQMLGLVEAMEEGLGGLLDAARGKYREFEGLVGLIDRD